MMTRHTLNTTTDARCVYMKRCALCGAKRPYGNLATAEWLVFGVVEWRLGGNQTVNFQIVRSYGEASS